MNQKINSKQLVVFSIILLIFFVLIVTDSFSYLRSSMSDRIQGEKTPLDNIVIIKIDDESINQIGRWPWNRDVFSELLLKIKDAKSIGVDVSFFEESSNDDKLEQTLDSMGNVILAAEINEDILFKPIFSSNFGYVNLVTDSDGITRSVKYGLSNEAEPFAFKIYEQTSDKQFQGKQYIINYVGNPNSFSSFSVSEILEGDFDLTDKIILIGATAPNLHDNYFVPTSDGIAMPGVEIHANIIQNIILEDFLSTQGKFSIFLFVLISAIGASFLSKTKIYYTIIIIISAILIYVLIGIFLFNNSNYVLDFFFFPLSLLIFTGTGIAVNYLEEKKHSAYLTDAFGRYVSKDLLKDIIDKKQELKLGGTKRDITIFFSDIRGFTSISEKLSPEELVHLINDYLTEMTKIILDHKGTVDKFIGDAVMAFWNAPFVEENHPKLACQSAIAQIKTLKKLQKIWKEKSYPLINIGCGINTGSAIIGNMGSEDRFDYTAMGDSVNLASRLEGLTKQYGVDIIVSESTKKLIEDEFTCRKLDAVKVKGKKIPIKIYELAVEPDSEYKKFKQQFEKSLEIYFKSQFNEAKKEFEKALNLKQEDVSSKLFISRCEEYIKNPPEKDWDGSFEMKTK